MLLIAETELVSKLMCLHVLNDDRNYRRDVVVLNTTAENERQIARGEGVTSEPNSNESIRPYQVN